MSTVKLLGTGCPSPSHERYGPSTLVQVENNNYLFDVGSGVTQRLSEFGIKSAAIDVLFVTHIHSDHIVDMYQLYISGWHQGREKPFKVIGPLGIKDFFEYQLKAFEKELEGRKKWEDEEEEHDKFMGNKKYQYDEDVTIDLDIGDTVKMGKFKNKKVVVKKIEWNEKGDMLINGKMATKWRMHKKAPKIPDSPFGEGVNVVKKKGKEIKIE